MRHATNAKLSSSSPSWYAAMAGLPVGVGILGFGVYLMTSTSMSGTLAVALMIFGVVETVVSYFSLRRLRAAWAFALSVNGTAFVSTLFGAPKIRDAAEISIGGALVPCVVFGVLALLHALSADEF